MLKSSFLVLAFDWNVHVGQKNRNTVSWKKYYNMIKAKKVWTFGLLFHTSIFLFTSHSTVGDQFRGAKPIVLMYTYKKPSECQNVSSSISIYSYSYSRKGSFVRQNQADVGCAYILVHEMLQDIYNLVCKFCLISSRSWKSGALFKCQAVCIYWIR